MPDEGEVEIQLNGETLVLRASLRAARMVNGMAGGFVGAFRGIQNFDLTTFATVIAAGTGKRTNAELEKVEEQVYSNGLDGLAAPISNFVTLLMNGGREKTEEVPAKGKSPAS